MSSHAETVAQIYRDFQAGEIAAILARLSPSCEWEHDMVDHGIPWIRPRVGPAEVMEFFGTLAAIEFHTFDVLNLLEGGSQVAGVVRFEATVRATGRRVHDLEIHLWTFDEEGRVARFRHFVDTRLHHDAAFGEPVAELTGAPVAALA